ncbi:PEP-dependent dihydroxyacetone kinase, dihydroxyacetone-binding subunit DhaK [Vibrio stylophorae]|uniref:PEP-dependent dihydroxyacetone kinase, dihydroxyacetone-binding subunit DhaK n=1 Tax=Vibrio stylophorae TaxID=659351 RepID=A0ABM8ZS34_9VIBR|nr:dihydroxyacetone kinase subunit DhaK [Vibrio stylophorae]CAH0533108.1 PEP-dependent dihydroxyacetone kinase, dihydroxyacetone-binding subunit DhaK [Vibrio stylophorae]
MKKLINRVEDVVKEQMEGLALSRPELQVSYEPRFMWHQPKQKQVALVSGGGSGHEPLHAGFIGEGMLTGACPGEVFTSPTPDQMYECGQKVNSGEGVLFVIKNYTGDVLNFETAVELLDADGVPVGAVLTDDDVAVKDSLYTAGRRGVAGTVLVEKIVGAAAAKGYDLAQCETLARRINDNCRSFGVALSACVVPAAGKPSFVLEENEIEFGVGIHGEPGIERRSYQDVDTLVDQMFAEIMENTGYSRTLRIWNRDSSDWDEVVSPIADFTADRDYIVMVNGLGATPESELYGVFRQVARNCEKAGIRIVRNLVGNYCTSINMEGVSITLLQADEEMLSLYDAPVSTAAMTWGK